MQQVAVEAFKCEFAESAFIVVRCLQTFSNQRDRKFNNIYI